MCYYVYLATTEKQRTIEWDKFNPKFFVEALSKDDGLRSIFINENVYYLGSGAGCSCGFIPGNESLIDLKEYLNNVSLSGEMFELLLIDLPYGTKRNIPKEEIQDLHRNVKEISVSVLKQGSDDWWDQLSVYNRFI